MACDVQLCVIASDRQFMITTSVISVVKYSVFPFFASTSVNIYTLSLQGDSVNSSTKSCEILKLGS